MAEDVRTRQVAYKTCIADLINGKFVKDDLGSGSVDIGLVKAFRVNIIAAVVDKSQGANSSSIIIDDGTGRIVLRLFENSNLYSKVEIGQICLVIARVREFNNEKYLIPDLIKKIDNMGWVAVRKAEIKKRLPIPEIPQIVEIQNGASNNNNNNNNEEVCNLIRSLDTGEGVTYEEIISKKTNAEEIIKKLLERGDIFEVKPGRLKILE